MKYRNLLAVAALAAPLALIATPAEAGRTWAANVCIPTLAIPAIPAIPGLPAKPAFWSEFSPNKDQGPFEGPPSYPTDEHGTWSAPKFNGGPGKAKVGVFKQGHGKAHGSWFYRAAAVEAVDGKAAVPAVPATFCPDPEPTVAPKPETKAETPKASTSKPKASSKPIAVAPLPKTGSDAQTWGIAGLGVALVAAGAGVTYVMRKRRGEL